MSIEKIIQDYKSDKNTELESLFQVNNRSILKKIAKSVLGTQTIEQTINFVAPDSSVNKICQISFVDGVKKKHLS